MYAQDLTFAVAGRREMKWMEPWIQIIFECRDTSRMCARSNPSWSFSNIFKPKIHLENIGRKATLNEATESSQNLFQIVPCFFRSGVVNPILHVGLETVARGHESWRRSIKSVLEVPRESWWHGSRECWKFQETVAWQRSIKSVLEIPRAFWTLLAHRTPPYRHNRKRSVTQSHHRLKTRTNKTNPIRDKKSMKKPCDARPTHTRLFRPTKHW